ncbi:Transposase IS200 like protein [Anatilimnocola aggregata]|uniref:Transposase IS200 like protein n=1 Tax=Anatilimnocola aggregata TaxID=2528021 RepID=A0A517Y577_9BACT|nr:transposase [Anatilimnocola aggregata]QDU25350.1 Transposase IS200 like protein [Anatilimnocola aggregata]
MPNYRRNYVPGGTYFFTVVTYKRRPLFHDEVIRGLFREAIQHVQAKLPFEMFASVLLPEHFHCIWTLPHEDANYSRRWRQIKEKFTYLFLRSGHRGLERSASQKRHREQAIWQRRFWEHTVRDVDDLERCTNYIHWNPVKHNLAQRVKDWQWSSFHRFVQAGDYPLDWGSADPCPGYHSPEWE